MKSWMRIDCTKLCFVCARAEKYSHISLSDNVVSHYLAIGRKG